MTSSKEKMQAFTSSENWYSINYPRMWDMEVFDNIPSFFDPISGNGALQIFSTRLGHNLPDEDLLNKYPFLGGKTLTDKMLLFLAEQNVNIKDIQIKEFILNNQLASAHEFFSENRFFMVSMMQKKDIFLLILYNSLKAPSDEEAAIITEMVKSINIIDKPEDE
ncbi:MAG: hypothetical protein OEZ13_11695 [Spirochaetia bacterium]|nr:hypothetical protein [Spirochaetia bacterium]